MRFLKAFTIGIWLGAVTLILPPSIGVASPLFPDVRASRSMNGKYLVVVEQTFDNPDPTAVRQVLRSTYVVLKSEPFTNSRDRLQTTAPFWSAFGWQVTPRGQASHGGFLPLISDDGQTLVLVGVGPAMKFGDQKVMWVYRQQGNTAKLVRAVPLTKVWTPEEIESDAVVGDMGETPMWYTGGSLEFSPDNRVLRYRSRWNDTVNIKLADGSITFEHK
jgi:hypothetical protein